MLRIISLCVAACMIFLAGCEEGPSGVNPSLELSVLDDQGRQVDFYANLMADGSDFKQCNIPFDASSGGFNSVSFSISDDGYIKSRFIGVGNTSLLDANLNIDFPLQFDGKGTYDLDTLSTTRVAFTVNGIRYTAVDGTIVVEDVASQGGFVNRAKGYFSAVLNGRNERTPADTKVYTLTISSCRFDNMSME